MQVLNIVLLIKFLVNNISLINGTQWRVGESGTRDFISWDHPSGSLNLPVEVIKRFVILISPPLTHLINQSLATGIVPQNMKIANISVVF